MKKAVRPVISRYQFLWPINLSFYLKIADEGGRDLIYKGFSVFVRQSDKERLDN